MRRQNAADGLRDLKKFVSAWRQFSRPRRSNRASKPRQPGPSGAQTLGAQTGPAPNKLAFKWIAVSLALVAAAALILAFFVLKTKPPPPLAATIETPTGTMILIPGGPFASGPDKQQVPVPDYYMDKTEVTNAAYEQYSKARGRPLPEGFAEAGRLPGH